MDLSTLIKVTDLGDTPIKGDEIITKTLELNKTTKGKLEKEDLKLIGQATNEPSGKMKVKITVADREASKTKFKGTVEVTFKLKPIADKK
ncbi:Uncharacterised protein [Mycoplasma putrefaciens]|nr:Uncharacterised protein [Mycoplasma putrefaciens]